MDCRVPLPCLLLPMTPGVSQTTSLGDADVLRLQGQRRRWRSLHGPQVAPQERCFAPAALRTPTLRFPRAAFRVCNQFEAVRSDGVLQTGSPTDMRGFSVSRDFITATVYEADPGGLVIGKTTARALSSGSWCIRVHPPAAHGARRFNIELSSKETGGSANFLRVRWGEISTGLDISRGVVIHSKLPQLRYCTPSPVTDGQRSAAEALRGRQLTGMVLSIPGPQVAPKTSVLDILSVPCAKDGPVQVLHGGVKMPQLFRSFPLDFYR